MPHRADFDKIELLLIRVLHTLITERSVSRAAMRLNSTQPAVSAQLKRLRAFHENNSALSTAMLERLRAAVVKNENVFDVLMDAVRVCSLGQITHALFDVGGQYRRSM